MIDCGAYSPCLPLPDTGIPADTYCTHDYGDGVILWYAQEATIGVPSQFVDWCEIAQSSSSELTPEELTIIKSNEILAYTLIAVIIIASFLAGFRIGAGG
jgi:hypothetical protein